MVDSDGDEWWFDASAEDFQLNGGPASLFADCVAPCSFEPKREPIKPHRKRVYPTIDCVGPYVRIPNRFKGKLIELKVKVCDE
jgi:hypothetical protein